MYVAVRQLKHYSWAALLTATAVGCLVWAQPHANLTTTALVLVLVVTVSAIAWGSGPALITALLSVFCFNYFFIPPIHTFTIAEPQNWIAFVVFVATAVAVGQLSSRARNRAEEAEARRIEIERLYRQLTEAFDRASEAETLRRSEQLKTALLDAVTHDLRTPLTFIKASVTTLLTAMGNNDGADSSLSAEGSRELLDVINEESDSLNHFVEEMMTLAQLEGGQLLLRRSEMPAQDIINIAVDRAATPLRERIINVSVANKLPPLVVDGASISGRIFALPVAVRQRVFEKFYRGPKEQGEKQGFGLGLSIARGVVEAHGGRIRMDAGPRGAGTAVRFTVPCAPGANADALTS